ncbi:MAG: M42 family peptidase [Gemmatimonadales bacterium]|nr:MAG: M42 family peptidase [Gemmatimonadales bacterium]
MTNPDPDFLARLLGEPGPSGFEERPARLWRQEAATFAEEVWSDVHGNAFAAVGRERRPRIMLAGHLDEIGVQITHVDEKGFCYFDGIGGWDSQVLVGQRIRLMGREGDVVGVVGKKPIHLMRPEERDKVSKIRDLWVDVGATSRDEVKEMGLRVGDAGVLDSGFVRLAGDRVASRAIDNRVGAWVVLEALRLLSEDPAPHAGCIAVGTVQEEIGYSGGGARSSAFSLEPDAALVVDVTFSTDVPDASPKETGEHRLGGGPVISRGSATHPLVVDRLTDSAEEAEIEHTLMAAPRASRTDADGIFLVRSGVPTGIVSIPNRYMHSPSEMVSRADLENAARLLAAFVRGLEADASFVRE